MTSTVSAQRPRLTTDELMVTPPRSENGSQRIPVEIQCQIRQEGLSSNTNDGGIDRHTSRRGRAAEDRATRNRGGGARVGGTGALGAGGLRAPPRVAPYRWARDRVPSARAAGRRRGGEPFRARGSRLRVHRLRRRASPPSGLHELPARRGRGRGRRRPDARGGRPPPRLPGRSRGARLLRPPRFPPAERSPLDPLPDPAEGALHELL